MEKNENILIFHSKVDWWLVVVVAGILLAGIALAVWVGVRDGSPNALIFVFFCEAITVSGLLAIALPVRYELHNEKVIVRTGVIRTEIPLKSIRNIDKCRGLMAGPTLSFDRLRIDYDHGGHPAYVFVSPENQNQFCEEVNRRRAA